MQDLFSGTADDPYRLEVAILRERAAAFSGYRHSKLKGCCESLELLRSRTCMAIEGLNDMGYEVFLCGMSDGFDMLAAEIVLDLKAQGRALQLINIIPFLGQHKSYSPEDQLRYEQINAQADYCHIMAEEYRGASQYLRRNDLMLHHASHLLCYFGGERGGTMYTHNRAVKLELPITNIAL